MEDVRIRKRLLLVSEHPRFFEAPENSFQSRGCDVFTAMGGPQAVEFLQTHSADLAIFDGLPSDCTPGQFSGYLSEGRNIVLLLPKETASNGWSALEGVHILEAPVSRRALLKLTSQLLGVPPRKFVSILVQVRVTKPKPTTVFGKTQDISMSGLLVETSQTLLLHDKVGVSFLIPGAGQMVQAEAVVMREVVRPGGARRYGLHFLPLDEESTTILQKCLSGAFNQK